jgi:hypothetical protein
VSKQLETAVTSAVQSTVGMGTQPAAAVSIMPGGHDVVAQTSDSDVRVDAGDSMEVRMSSADPPSDATHARHSLKVVQHTALGGSTKTYFASAASVRHFVFICHCLSSHEAFAAARFKSQYTQRVSRGTRRALAVTHFIESSI